MGYDGPVSQTPELSSGKCSSSPQITEKTSDKNQGSKPTPTSSPLQSEGFIPLALPWSTSSRFSPQLYNTSSPSLPISVLKDPNLSIGSLVLTVVGMRRRCRMIWADSHICVALPWLNIKRAVWNLLLCIQSVCC